MAIWTRSAFASAAWPIRRTCNAVPPESLQYLEGLDLWIIDALRHQRHGTHLSVGQALELIEQFKPRRAILTDLHVDLDYDALAATCRACDAGLRRNADRALSFVHAVFEPSP